MSNVAFLLIAVVLSIIGSLWLWLRSRKPHRWDSGIEDFAREMQALSPQAKEPRRGWRRRADLADWDQHGEDRSD